MAGMHSQACSQPVARPFCSPRRTQPLKGRLVRSQYIHQRYDDVVKSVQQYRSNFGVEPLSDDFTCYADSCRFISDTGKDQRKKILQSLETDVSVELGPHVVCVCQDEPAAFIVQAYTANEVPHTSIARLDIDEQGRVSKLWERRPLFGHEVDQLLRGNCKERYNSHLALLPDLDIRASNNSRRDIAGMLAAVDEYVGVMNAPGTPEARGHLKTLVSENFKAWEGTGLWNSDIGFGMEGAEAEMEALAALCDAGGQGRLRVILRSHAASESHNVACAAVHILGSGRHGSPIAADALLAFTFTPDVGRVDQAVTLRAPLSIREYASVFHLPADVA